MFEETIEKMLEDARLATIEMGAHRAFVKSALERAVSRRRREARPLRKAFFAVGVTVGAVLGAVFVLLIKDAEARFDPADTLASTWYTYTDGRGAESTAVWPPSSSLGQNTFVKSAPGYGGRGYAVRFKGTIFGETRPGFMGVGTLLGPPCLRGVCNGVDIRKYEKIRFDMKGRVRGGTLMLLISGREQTEDGGALSANGSKGDFEADITKNLGDDWRRVTLDLRDDFAAAPPAKAPSAPSIEAVLSDTRQVKWHVRGENRADVDVWIDNLEFY